MSRKPSSLTTSLPEAKVHAVESFDGVSLTYDLYDAGSGPVILVVPGFWRTRRHASMRALASLLLAHGYRPAICDLRGHGTSGGVFGFNRDEHHDIAALLNDLRDRTGAGAISIVAFSYGAAIAISAAARHRLPVASIACISPVAEFGLIAPKVNLVTIYRHVALSQALRRPRFEWRLRRVPKHNASDDIAQVGVPVCLIHFKDDWLIDHRHSVALFDRASEPKELHIIDRPGNYHADRIFSVAPDAIEPPLLDFLQRYAPK